MGLDNFTKVIFGWKIEGKENAEKFQNDMDKLNEDWYDEYQDVISEDTMCGNYIFIGAELVSYDADEGGEEVINDKLIKKSTSTYNKFMNSHPEFNDIVKNYIGTLTTSKEPQLFVFQQIW